MTPAQRRVLDEIAAEPGRYVQGPNFSVGYVTIKLHGRRVRLDTLDALVQAGRLRRRAIQPRAPFPDGRPNTSTMSVTIYEVPS